jgi:xylulokinase
LAGGGAAGVAPEARGRLDGLQLSHEPPHVFRAVVEGLACELGRHLDFLKDAGLPVARLVMCGSAATGRTTPQIVADVTGVPVSCPQGGWGSLRGAAILARSLVEPVESLAELAAGMTPMVQVIDPGPDGPFYRDLLSNYRQSLPLAAGPLCA